jgi:putative transposase
MRVEPFGVGSFVHVMKRGTRGLPIVRHEADRRRFARLLYLVNEVHRDENWESKTASLEMFERPYDWPEREPLTRILAWVLMPNHFHLILEETEEGGVSKFMQRLCGSMSANFNAKYGEKGSIFQGGYKGRTIHEDGYLRLLAPYVMVKNVFELYPGGYDKALKEFDKAWDWGVSLYPFSSLPDYAGARSWPIIDKGLFGEMFPDGQSFRRHAKEMLFNRAGVSDELRILFLE